MGLYKEVDHFFTEQAKRQERIYNDAADIGIEVVGFNDPLCTDLKQIFNDTGKWKGFMTGIKKHRSLIEDNDGDVVYSAVSVHLPWEYENGLYRCTKWTVAFSNDVARKKKFVSFCPSQAWCEENKVWETN